MFFANPVAAMRNVRRSLRVGATLVMVGWRRKLDTKPSAVPDRVGRDRRSGVGLDRQRPRARRELTHTRPLRRRPSLPSHRHTRPVPRRAAAQRGAGAEVEAVQAVRIDRDAHGLVLAHPRARVDGSGEPRGRRRRAAHGAPRCRRLGRGRRGARRPPPAAHRRRTPGASRCRALDDLHVHLQRRNVGAGVAAARQLQVVREIGHLADACDGIGLIQFVPAFFGALTPALARQRETVTSALSCACGRRCAANARQTIV
jgi:hypothetical protein